MEDYEVIIVVLVVILLYYLCSCGDNDRQKFSCNTIDGRCYKFSSPQTSPILGTLNMFNVKLLRHLRDKYIDTNTSNKYAEHATQLMLNTYNPDNLIENITNDPDNTSYVEDKGRVMALCLREMNTQKIHEIEILKFVNLHELSHLAMERRDNSHLTDFWTCFKWLIKEATEIGYKPINFQANPIVYCGVPVSYNPYFDDHLAII